MAATSKIRQTTFPSGRVIAIDPSLTCSGWALFDLASGGVVGVGEVRSLPPTEALSNRLADLQERIFKLIKRLGLAAGDFLVCEGPTTMRDPAAAIKVEQVRGIFEAVARFGGLLVPGRINPKSVHGEILGFNGRQRTRAVVKKAALDVALQLYGLELQRLGLVDGRGVVKSQDVVDAILVGTVAVERFKRSESSGICLTEVLRSSYEGRRRARQQKSWRVE